MGEARRRGTVGVICGHIHHPVVRTEDGLCYINCGDWVESCTAIVEHFDGRIEIVERAERQDLTTTTSPLASKESVAA
jgi:UDP-2,3-diacylglucosamine pyrophosphatase LpxH